MTFVKTPRGFIVFFFIFSFVGNCFGYDSYPTLIESKVTDSVRNPVSVKAEFIDAFMSFSRSSQIESLTVTEDGKRLWSMSGKLSEPLEGDLVKASLNFLTENSQIFNIPQERDEKTFNVVRNEMSAGGYHVSFQMQIKGYPVHEAVIELHLSEDKRITLAHGSFPTVVNLKENVRLSSKDAIEKAKILVGSKKLYETPFATTKIYPVSGEGNYAIAYTAAIPSEDPLGSFLVTIDAETGEELDRSNEMLFLHEGKGAVYKNHPNISPLTIEPLKYLASTTITGLFAAMRNPKAPNANKPDSMHIYDVNDTHFDEANVYYHINFVHDFFASFGFTKLDRPVPVVVHYGDKLDNAVFDSVFGVIGFGDGDNYHSFAKEETIIYHEYSHCALNEIIKMKNAGESGAMNEGQADYFGSSMTNDPLHGEYVSSKAGLPYIRNLVNNLTYPTDIVGKVHKDGQIWSGTLWDLRKALGSEITDRLLHGSHFYLKGERPTFHDGFIALITADENLYNGKNKAVITSVMNRRGVRASAYRGAVLDKNNLRTIQTFRNIHGR
ncbi:MAG: M36 family metallopeptidase [Candidatus Riflebacteria bacterium]|nr:M36 family metallopeptidase [Candidatus Riflebacteria bacterium]